MGERQAQIVDEAASRLDDLCEEGLSRELREAWEFQLTVEDNITAGFDRIIDQRDAAEAEIAALREGLLDILATTTDRATLDKATALLSEGQVK